MAPILALDPTARQIMSGQNVIWFLDNMGALGSLIKANSSNPDIAPMAMLAQVSMYSVQARPYYEWVRSSANTSDAPSRGETPRFPNGTVAKELQVTLHWPCFLDTFAEARKRLRAMAEGV